MYSNCVLYNGIDNVYTKTAQKLLDTCKQACDIPDYREKFQNLEDQIALAYHVNQAPIRHASSVSMDAFTDNESNAGANTTNELSETSTAPLKKPKPNSIKKLPVNQNNPNLNVIKPSSSGLQAKKKKIFPMGEIVKHKNSPRSGSDAEVFVDVESIDERVNSEIDFLPFDENANSQH